MRCLGIKNSFKRCSNTQKRPFCRHHLFQPFGFFVVAILLPFIINFTSSLAYDSATKTRKNKLTQEFEIICDRNKGIGCNLNLGNSFIKPDMNYIAWPSGKKDSFPESYFQMNIIAGGKKAPYYLPIKRSKEKYLDDFSITPPIPESGASFPFFKDDKESNGPFKIKGDSTNLLFFGQIKDYKTGELLGWFDENEFGVVESCSFSWNKDANGIEIIDKYGNVCFSIDLNKQTKSITFKGYYKKNDTYYILNSKKHKTKDQQKAEELIKNIKPIFDHYGKNSNGKRI